MSDSQHWCRRSLRASLIIVASLLMWLEENLWLGLKWLTSKWALMSCVQWFESQIRRLPPYATVVVFFLPLVLLLPFKLLAVYWLSQGYWFRSLAVIVAAKIFGTAVEARMFVVCKPKLMAIPWFQRLHDWVIGIKDRLYAAVRALPVYQAIRARLLAIKLATKQFLTRIRLRLKSLRHWYRRKNDAP